MKHTKKIGALILTAAFTIGGTSAALAGANGDGGGASKEDRIAVICADPDAALAKMAERQANVTARIATLTTKSAEATAAGRTKVAARIDRVIARLNGVLERITTRIDNAPAWVAEHCG